MCTFVHFNININGSDTNNMYVCLLYIQSAHVHINDQEKTFFPVKVLVNTKHHHPLLLNCRHDEMVVGIICVKGSFFGFIHANDNILLKRIESRKYIYQEMRQQNCVPTIHKTDPLYPRMKARDSSFMSLFTFMKLNRDYHRNFFIRLV